MPRTHRIHMISFERIGENAYATVHPGKERMQPFMLDLLAELLKNEVDNLSEGAEDLA